MRPRFDNGSSKPPQDVECMGKVVIRNIRIRFVSDDSLRVWLDKYGKIEETKIYSNCAVVKFSSDLEAAGAVQCEDGIRRFGSIASVKHAEPEILRALERTEPLRMNDYQGSAGGGGGSGSESRSRRRRSPSVDNDSSRSRKRSPSPRISSAQTRKGPKGPSSSSTKDSHPLTWLSEAAEKSRQLNSADRSSKPEPPSKNSPPASTSGGGHDNKAPRPYEVAVLAITHDLVPYAEVVQERIAALAGSVVLRGCHLPRSHIMVLVSIDHLTPCIQDLTNDGVLYAVIVNGPNWTHSSCILRILHSATQQEHRNMPLSDAIDLLAKDYVAYLGSASPLLPTTAPKPPRAQPLPPPPSSSLRQVVPSYQMAASSNSGASRPTPPPSHSAAAAAGHSPGGAAAEPLDEIAPEPDDPTFIKPSRHVATLLRMLADSRVLSVGELDELVAFIAERRARLTSQYTSALPGAAATTSTAALKSRILDMLYPNQKQQGQPPQQSQDQSTAEHGNAAATAPTQQYKQPTTTVQEQLVSKLQDPSVQQALNNLLQSSQNAAAASQPQPGTGTTTTSSSKPTPPFSRSGQNQSSHLNPASSSSWQPDWRHSMAANAPAPPKWPPSSSSSAYQESQEGRETYAQALARWGAGDENNNNNSGRQRYGYATNLMEIDVRPPWQRGSKRAKRKFGKRPQHDAAESISPPSYSQHKYPRNEEPSAPAPGQNSRFVLPPQVVPSEAGAGADSNRSAPPYAPPPPPLSSQGDAAAAAAPTPADPYQSLYASARTYAGQHYGGPGAPPGVPSFQQPAEPMQQQQSKGWSAYGSGYENY